MVGAVYRPVIRYFSIAAIMSSGPIGLGKNRVDAPNRIGKHVTPPSPNVNASGGVPVKISCGSAMLNDRGKQSVIAMTSRWKCIVALGDPVVPDVKAISAVSSAAVSQLSKPPDLAATAWSREASPSPVAVKYRTSVISGLRLRVSSIASASEASHRAWRISAFSTM